MPKVAGATPEKAAAGNGAFCIWFMGLSASGKTTLARLLGAALEERGFSIAILDGDIVRISLSRGLGFSREDRETNLRRIATQAQRLVRQQIITIVAAICPYHDIREEVRSTIGDFVEIYVNCPLEVCISRDPKGLYQKALAGEIRHFTGIDDVFETPVHPDLEVVTDAETPEESLARILCGLEGLRRLSAGAVVPGKQEDKKLADLPASSAIP